ncbi:hypothetical protein HYY75_07060 [bacterium]|nr:hypothetical protein [bacterium]
MILTPEIRKYAITCHFYRQLCFLILVILFSLPFPFSSMGSNSDVSEPSTITRMGFLEQAGMSLLGKSTSEIEALSSGILEPYPDSRFHLDWPVSRGMAAKILNRLLLPSIRSHPLPSEFSDLKENSSLRSALSMVGGAFKPLLKNRFGPDRLLSKKEANAILQRLSKHLRENSEPFSSGASLTESLSSSPSSENLERRFPMGFITHPTQTETTPTETDLIASSDTSRLGRLNSFSFPEQWSPDENFDINSLENGILELESSLDSLELSAHELTTCTPDPGEEESGLRTALTTIRQISFDARKKLKYSEIQLNAALVVDEESIRRCASLKKRLVFDISRLSTLLEKIDSRLKKDLKETANDARLGEP